jgi:hypothetical protein
MKPIYNIYCDESCHLEHDQQKAMVLGAVWCPLETVKKVSHDILALKSSHGLSRTFELKWVKVSPGKLDFYLDILDYFFDSEELRFRGVVVPDKSRLQHDRFSQEHDDWYYKMFFVHRSSIQGHIIECTWI